MKNVNKMKKVTKVIDGEIKEVKKKGKKLESKVEVMNDNDINDTIVVSNNYSKDNMQENHQFNDIGDTIIVSRGLNYDDLNAADKAQVDCYKSQIDITNMTKVNEYGAGAQSSIVSFSQSLLSKTSTSGLGEVGESLKDLTIALNESTTQEKKGLFGLFRKARLSLEAIKANYSKAESNVRKIESDLKKHQGALMSDIQNFNHMYDMNLKSYKELSLYLIAGYKALDEARNIKLEELKNKAEETKDSADIEAARNYDDYCQRFDRRLHDLSLTRISAMQQAPTIRMLQSSDEQMYEKIQSSIINSIPMWRTQLVYTIGLEHSKRATDAQRAVTNMTNQLLKQNAEKLHQGTIESAVENERAVIDVDTLKFVNSQLISSLSEVVKIHEEGETKRIEAKRELCKIEDDLKQALLENIN